MERRKLDLKDLDGVITEIDSLRKGGYQKAGNWDLAMICNPDWSPDGSRIAFWGRETVNGGANLFVYDIAADVWTNLGLTSNHGCEGLSWSPDGTRWVVNQDDGIRIVDADPNSSSYGQVIPRKNSKLAFGGYPAWRPCETGSDGCGLAP